MSQDDQQPIKCDKCGTILSQIEPDESVPSKCLHWGQRVDYWSVEFRLWEKDLYYQEKDGESKHEEAENYHLCIPCKEKMCKVIKGEGK